MAHVAFEEMRAVAGRLHDGEAAIRDTLASLKAEVDALMGAGFTTDHASDAFGESYAEVDDAIGRALDSLQEMRTVLTKAADAYETADGELAKGIGRRG